MLVKLSNILYEERISWRGVSKVFGGRRSVSGLRFPTGVLNRMESILRGEKTPLSIPETAGCLSGVNPPGVKLVGVLPCFGVTKLYSGESERASISTSGMRFLTGVRKEASKRFKLLSFSFEFGVADARSGGKLCGVVVVEGVVGRIGRDFFSCRGQCTEILESFLRFGVEGAS